MTDLSLIEIVDEVIAETEANVEVLVNSSFSLIEPQLQLAHDSTSIKAGTKCWRFYKYSIIDGYGASGRENDHLKFGTIFHAATELYDRLRAKGADHAQGIQGAVRYALVSTWDFELGRPWASEEPTKSRDTLLRTIVLYLDRYKDSPLETLILADGTPAVELSFRLDLELRAPTSEHYLLCGHIDKAIVFEDKIKLLDKKTTKSALDDQYFEQFTPDIQMSVYPFAGKIIFSSEINGMIIDAAQILVNGSRFRRKVIERSEAQLGEWFEDFQTYLHELERNIADNYWPMRTTSCGFGYFQCTFRPVCSTDPSMRQAVLDHFYTKRKTWDPKVPRTESQNNGK